MEYRALGNTKVEDNLIVYAENSCGEHWPAIVSPCPDWQGKGLCVKPGTDQVWVDFFDNYSGMWVCKSRLKRFEPHPVCYEEKFYHAYMAAVNCAREMRRKTRREHAQLSQLCEGALVLAKYRSMPPWPARVERAKLDGTWKKQMGRLRSSNLIYVSFINLDICVWLPCVSLCLYKPGRRFGGFVHPGAKLYRAYDDALYSILLSWEKQNGLEHYDTFEHILSPRQNLLDP